MFCTSKSRRVDDQYRSSPHSEGCGASSLPARLGQRTVGLLHEEAVFKLGLEVTWDDRRWLGGCWA